MDDRQFKYDAFISYSRRDIEFVRLLHKALTSYRPPRDLPVPQRTLRVFRDETDFHGPEYHASLVSNLQASATLIVVCSPNSAASQYVGDEIARFADGREQPQVITVLLDGIPNNEAKPDESARRAFHEQLIRRLPIPLAADYRGFDLKRDSMTKGRFTQAWFKMLADVYASYGIDRSRIEQREQKRRAERLRNIAVTASAIAVALIGLTVWALVSRHEATVQRDLATAGQREAEARLAFDSSGDGLIKATLLSAESMRSSQTVEGLVAMTRFLELLPRQPDWRHPLLAKRTGSGDDLRPALAFSTDGMRIAATGNGRELAWLDARSGKETERIRTACLGSSNRPVLAFSPNGALLAVGCTGQVCLFGASTDVPCTILPTEGRKPTDMVWSASFSPDSKLLATASYHSGDVLVTDTATAKSERVVVGGSDRSIRATAMSPDGRWLVATWNEGIRLWRTGQYQAPAAEELTTDDATSVAFEPDGDAFVTGGRELVRWRIVTGNDGNTTVQLQQQARLAVKAHSVLPVQWRNKTCIAAATLSAVHLVCGEKLIEVLRIPTSSVAVTVSPDGQRVVNQEADGTVAAWPLDGGLDIKRIPVGAAVRSIAIALDRSWLAAGSDDGSVTVFDTQTWKQRQRLQAPAAVAKILRSADGRWLVVRTDTSFRVFDTTTWNERTTENYDGTLRSVAFTPDERLLIAVGDRSVVGFSTTEWRREFELAHDGSPESVTIDANGTRAAVEVHYSGGRGPVRFTRVSELVSGKQLAWKYAVGAHDSFTHQRMLEVIAERQTTETGGDLALLEQSASWPSLPVSIPTSPEARTPVWTADAFGSVITATHTLTERVIGKWEQEGDITDLLFLPEGAPRWLVSASDDGLLRLWALTADDLIPEACARLKNIRTCKP